jgi:hypothetical protein
LIGTIVVATAAAVAVATAALRPSFR